MIKVIFAVGSNGEFGLSNKLPWGDLPKEDKDQFVNFTRDSVIVMGRNTWDSLPKKLPNRKHVVISSSPLNVTPKENGETPDKVVINPDNDLEKLCKELEMEFLSDVTIIGGQSFIEHGVHFADKVSMTLVTPVGDWKLPYDVSLSIPLLTHQLNWGYDEYVVSNSIDATSLKDGTVGTIEVTIKEFIKGGE